MNGSRWTWLDLRLVPAAALSWLGALLLPQLGAAVLVAVAGTAVVLALPVARRPGPAAFVGLGVLAALALTSGAAALRSVVRDASPLHAVAERNGTVQVELVLDDLPRPVSGAGPARTVTAATVTAVRDDRRVTRVDDAVLLFAPAADWADVPPGREVRARVTVVPSREAGLVAVLTARGPPPPAGSPGWVQATA